MTEKDALTYLQENLVGHRGVLADNSESELVTLASGSKIESLERFQPSPNRIKRHVRMLSCDSFCDYVNRFKSDDSSIYLDCSSGSFDALLDHHSAKQAQWCDHTVNFQPGISIEWQAWVGIHKKKLSQIELALFVETNLDAIVVPEPNVMLKAALDFQATEALALGSQTNLDDGSTRFTFTKDNVRKDVDFPHRISLAIPLFENEDKHSLEGRIRYRVDNNGGLNFVFSFVRDPAAIKRDAMVNLSEKIRAQTGDVHQYEGTL